MNVNKQVDAIITVVGEIEEIYVNDREFQCKIHAAGRLVTDEVIVSHSDKDFPELDEGDVIKVTGMFYYSSEPDEVIQWRPIFQIDEPTIEKLGKGREIEDVDFDVKTIPLMGDKELVEYCRTMFYEFKDIFGAYATEIERRMRIAEREVQRRKLAQWEDK